LFFFAAIVGVPLQSVEEARPSLQLLVQPVFSPRPPPAL
jgi:hypothetical protein